jgi:uncharacterized membrane protein (UPF0136 family)
MAFSHEIWQLYAGGHTTDEIKARLYKRELDPGMIDEVVGVVREMRLKRQRGRGLITAGIGALVLVSAFIVTYILSINGMPTALSLYGLTSVWYRIVIYRNGALFWVNSLFDPFAILLFINGFRSP